MAMGARLGCGHALCTRVWIGPAHDFRRYGKAYTSARYYLPRCLHRRLTGIVELYDKPRTCLPLISRRRMHINLSVVPTGIVVRHI